MCFTTLFVLLPKQEYSTSRLTWTQARDKCKEQGQVLLRLHTVGEWNDFKSFLKHNYKTFRCLFIGLQNFGKSAPDMYWGVWHWVGGAVALYINISVENMHSHGAKITTGVTLEPVSFASHFCNGHVCEQLIHNQKHSADHVVSPPQLSTTDKTQMLRNLSLVQCPDGHVTRDFLSCESQSRCGMTCAVFACPLSSPEDKTSISFDGTLATLHSQEIQVTPKYIPMFVCDQGRISISYSLVCNYREECSDVSDEDFCKHTPCPKRKKCWNEHCVLQKKNCDAVRQCEDGSDEVRASSTASKQTNKRKGGGKSAQKVLFINFSVVAERSHRVTTLPTITHKATVGESK